MLSSLYTNRKTIAIIFVNIFTFTSDSDKPYFLQFFTNPLKSSLSAIS
nr:MAG TPA: hypothetical protein [Caudoviricetes sp.]